MIKLLLTILAQIVLFLPVLGEYTIDNWFWDHGWNDKWFTRITRTFLFGGAVVLAWSIDPYFPNWWMALAVSACYHGYFFPPIINKSPHIDKPPCYLGTGDWDSFWKQFDCYYRAGFFMALLVCAVWLYYTI